MRYRIGVDIGGTGIKIGLVDENNQIVNRHSLPTGAERPYLSVVEDIVKGIASRDGCVVEKGRMIDEKISQMQGETDDGS